MHLKSHDESQRTMQCLKCGEGFLFMERRKPNEISEIKQSRVLKDFSIPIVNPEVLSQGLNNYNRNSKPAWLQLELNANQPASYGDLFSVQADATME